jgi:hypothetical protein
MRKCTKSASSSLSAVSIFHEVKVPVDDNNIVVHDENSHDKDGFNDRPLRPDSLNSHEFM